MRYAGLIGLCCALQLGLALYFAPPSVLLSTTPVSGGDYSTHAEQTHRVLEGLSGWGQSWVYDVQLLAGFPNGTVFDADNKGWELFTFALHSFGVPEGRAFNLFALLVFVLLPVPLMAAARVSGLTRGGALLAALLGTLLFFFDSLLHWLCWVGTLSFVLAAYLCPLALALFDRFLRARAARDLVLLTLLLAVIHLVHPYAFFVLAPPMWLACVRARATLSVRELSKLGAMGATVIAANAYWLVVALRHFHYVLDSSFLMSGNVRQVAFDFLELLSNVETTGVIANHTGFRVLVFAAGAAGLVLLRDGSDFPAGIMRNTLLWVLPLAYLGDHVPVLQQVQPYRFVVPAMFVAVLPAAYALQQLPVLVPWHSLSRAARVFVVVGLVSIGQHLAGEVHYFFPDALPKVRWFLDSAPAPITATGFAPHPSYRLAKQPVASAAIARFADAHHEEGRIAVQDAALGEDLAARTRASILGGFWFCNLEHSHSNLFRRLLEGPLSAAQIREHLIAYAVRYVVLTFPDARIDKDAALFEPYTQVHGYRIYRSKMPVSLLAEGRGEVSAQTNRLSVDASAPDEDLVLRFHWHEALRCTAGCTRGIEKARNPTGGVPFIRVRAPHAARVVIENSYRM